MEKSKAAWAKNPTKKQVVIVFVSWLAALFLSVLSITDLFRRSFFQKGYFTIYLLIFLATGTMIRVFRNYQKTHRKKD